ncbi:MAG TPA: bifunctional heptose 7-phosphate kinase/heptose 1-phosphate adenyltransferase, partial [Campylobacterales bacterium]|nr:bifunctional heptose 7-phosphate kinase/heptose 1-phosphate adenyltransferase [Campylobacterales bacterium]
MIELKNRHPNVLVIGDLMIDHYLWGKCERISPEAPVPVVAVEKETAVLGGAGNVIHNLSVLGAKVSVLSVIGDDTNAQELKTMLQNIKVNTDNLVVQVGRNTSKKSRIIASQQQVVRYDK